MSHAAARRVVRRRIALHSHSLTLALPRTFLYYMGVHRGDYLVVQLIPEDGSVTISRLRTLLEHASAGLAALRRSHATRKLIRHGNSYMVTIPRAFLHALHAFQGDLMTVELSEDHSHVTMRPVMRRAVGPDAPAPIHAPAEAEEAAE